MENLDALFLAVAALGPGFLITYLVNLFITGRRPKATETLLEFFMVSAVYYSVFGPVFIWLPLHGLFSWLILFFLVPLFVGFLIGFLYQHDVFDFIFRAMRMNPVHPATTAWDFAFGRMKESKWVTITTQDGERIRGWFDRSSAASSDLERRDIFIADVRGENFERIEKDGRRRGMWLNESEIKAIEFVSD